MGKQPEIRVRPIATLTALIAGLLLGVTLIAAAGPAEAAKWRPGQTPLKGGKAPGSFSIGSPTLHYGGKGSPIGKGPMVSAALVKTKSNGKRVPAYRTYIRQDGKWAKQSGWTVASANVRNARLIHVFPQVAALRVGDEILVRNGKMTKRIKSPSRATDLLGARSRLGSTAAFGWLAISNGKLVFRGALVGRDVPGLNKRRIKVIKKNFGPLPGGVAPINSCSNAICPRLIVDKRGGLGLLWQQRDGSVLSAWKKVNGDWSGIETVKPVPVGSPSNPLEARSRAADFAFDTSGGSISEAVIAWSATHGGTRHVVVEKRAANGTRSQLGETWESVAAPFGERSEFSVDALRGRYAVAWRRGEGGGLGQSFALVNGTLAGESEFHDLGFPDAIGYGGEPPTGAVVLMTSGRAMMLAQDSESGMVARLFRPGNPADAWTSVHGGYGEGVNPQWNADLGWNTKGDTLGVAWTRTDGATNNRLNPVSYREFR